MGSSFKFSIEPLKSDLFDSSIIFLTMALNKTSSVSNRIASSQIEILNS